MGAVHRARDLARDIHARSLVQCDLTARKVRSTGDGREKLLDSSAMAPPRKIIGTPPFASPEMVQRHPTTIQLPAGSAGTWRGR
ncbi:MAG: hypothetical protein OXT09_01395 [Myxococcales bacterium]|nr:hypothetical protein [Myxococcales bacterium]